MDEEDKKLPDLPVAQPVPAPRKAPRWIREYWTNARVNALARRIMRKVPRLDRPEFRPLIDSFASVTVLSSRILFELSQRKNLINQDGNAPAAIDTFRRLVATKRNLADDPGLSPSIVRSFTPTKRA